MSIYYVNKQYWPGFVTLFVTGGLFWHIPIAYSSENVEFNTDILDLQDQQKFDLSQFARKGYILPGTYNMVIRVNKIDLPEQPVLFIAPEDAPKESVACISPAMVEQFGIKKEYVKKIAWTHNGACIDPKSLEGMEVTGDLGSSALYVNLPQAYLEYSSEYWDPPSRWDNGISGAIFDYNLNLQTIHQQDEGEDNSSITGNGTTGINFGSWRFRADWQSRLEHSSDDRQYSQNNWDWSRVYAYRPLPSIGAKLTLGEDYLSSGMFDSFRYTGASVNSDDNMLPPNLRGYAPEITGIARTSARVTVSQQGRVLYETQVASGPFRIQDLNDAVSGKLDVRVEEQDGSVQEFQIETASIPYLTRPGLVRYKFAAGRPTDWEHHTDGPVFGTGEFSWGVSNGWSLYGGLLGGENYQAASLGIGRDLLMFGAMSFDITQSHAQPKEQDTQAGRSYRVSYSKHFDELDSQVTFAGYRFSEREFMSMSEFLDAENSGERIGGNKEMYTMTFNKQFRGTGLSVYLNYSHQTYWDMADSEHYNISLSRFFDFGKFKNMSVSLSAYRNNSFNSTDDGAYVSLSVPLENGASMSYDLNTGGGDTSHQVGYSDKIDERTNYNLRTGVSGQNGALASAFIEHRSDLAQGSLNVSYQEGQYSSLGLNLQGGLTSTLEGTALHSNTLPGGTRLLVDTDGVADVPIRGYGPSKRTNRFGKAVLADINSYYRNKASVDLNQLADNAEVTHSVAEITLTEGAIGYRKFEVIAGEKMMALVRLADGSVPPFGATVLNEKNQVSGIIGDSGNVYLSGINPGQTMMVNWDGTSQCAITLPERVDQSTVKEPVLLLPCRESDTQKTLQSTGMQDSVIAKH